jgi:hypothetical protein
MADDPPPTPQHFSRKNEQHRAVISASQIRRFHLRTHQRHRPRSHKQSIWSWRLVCLIVFIALIWFLLAR